MSTQPPKAWVKAAHNTRVQVGLTGNGVGGPSQVALDLIALLKSDTVIDQVTREIIAEALERGLYGMRTVEMNEFDRVMPRLVVEGTGRDGRVSEAIATRRNWLNAVEDLTSRRARGEKGASLIEAVGSDYGLGFEAMRKYAIPFANRMDKAIRDRASECVVGACQVLGVSPADFDPDDPDDYYLARSIFIEASAEADVK